MHENTQKSVKSLKRQQRRSSQANAFLRSWDFKCGYCDRPLTALTMTRDHFVPDCRGGLNRLDNLVACCNDCNQAKADKWPEDFVLSEARMTRILAVLAKAR